VTEIDPLDTDQALPFIRHVVSDTISDKGFDSQNAVQEIWLEAFTKSIPISGIFVKHRTIDLYRKRVRALKKPLVETPKTPILPQRDESVEAQVSRKDELDRVLSDVSGPDSILLYYTFYKGLSAPKIALKCGLNVRYVRRRLRLVLTLLKESHNDSGRRSDPSVELTNELRATIQGKANQGVQ